MTAPLQPTIPAAPDASSPLHAPVFIRPGFHWDAYDAYLFDIDGTLLRSRDRVHYDSFFAAVEHVTGKPLVLDGVTLHGNTDPGILRDAFQRSGLEESAWRPHFDDIFRHMTESVTAKQLEMDLHVMPGVIPTLEHLKRRGAALGVATGNIETIGWIKVAVAGLRDSFTFGGFADRYDQRADMIANALLLAREAAGPQATVCVVGDTKFDVLAARANGLPTIAVATGNYSFDELMEAEPEICATSLEALLLQTATSPAEVR
ncbi:HAD family hydrolase [Acidipila sp. EB88]|uniref:HAD family hydrolase n=1 Tax=Acidipila sp. EB88 TaxID=2305226 RepID=UPI000F5DA420|nr:HAD family hydrolase [Acidipila sp. EB88]RRA47209.1 HAD family hydrolase [Acidipila sp. EB88]